MSCRVRARGGITIVKIPIKGPSSFTYNGDTKTLTFTDLESDYVTITGNSAVNAGNYTATATLKDGNYAWADGTIAPKTYSWSIAKLSVSKPYFSGTTSWTYDGSSHSPTVYNYNSSYMTQSGTRTATNAGSYSVTYSLRDSSNTQWSDGTTSNVVLSWSISKRSRSKPWVTMSPITGDIAPSGDLTSPCYFHVVETGELDSIPLENCFIHGGWGMIDIDRSGTYSYSDSGKYAEKFTFTGYGSSSNRGNYTVQIPATTNYAASAQNPRVYWFSW